MFVFSKYFHAGWPTIGTSMDRLLSLKPLKRFQCSRSQFILILDLRFWNFFDKSIWCLDDNVIV